MTREEAIARLRAVVDADDAIERMKADRAAGMIVYRFVWRAVYAEREKADRELWGTCADDRARVARDLLAALSAAN